MSGFPDLVDDLDDMIMDSLSDGTATYLSRTGQVLAEGVPVIVEKDVERFGEGGAVDRVRTHEVQKRYLQPFDRQGAFVMDGKTWHIDGIERDDGHMITLYVVP
jgi:putative transposon-encoded protein